MPWTQVSVAAHCTLAHGSGSAQASAQLPPGQMPLHISKGTHWPLPGLQRSPEGQTTWAQRLPKQPDTHAPWMQVWLGPQTTPLHGSTWGMQDATHTPASQKSGGQGSGWQ